VSFQRTLRLPDRGGAAAEPGYPLPPGLGLFPLRRAADYAGRVPDAWVAERAHFFPMYRREAMWIGFDGAPWKPNAVKVGVGGVSAVSGLPWDARLRADPQDYVVVPEQPWLDGVVAGGGAIRQFVAVPLGEGLTVEGQLTGAERVGGVQLLAFEPRPGRFPDEPPPPPPRGQDRPWESFLMEPAPAGAGGHHAAMGLGAGGRMRQLVYPDPYGLGCWAEDAHGSAVVHIVDGAGFRAITGEEPPPSPVDARAYTAHGLPWFDLYDEGAPGVPAPEGLARVRSVGEIERERGGADRADDDPLRIDAEQVRRLEHGWDAGAGEPRPPRPPRPPADEGT